MKKKGLSKSNIRKIYSEMAESVVLDTFKSYDNKISRELRRLEEIEGITPSCKKGCFFCCRQIICVPLPEVHVIANYIKKTLNETEINKLKAQTIQWLQWVRNELPAILAKGINHSKAFYNYGPYCPLLADGECSVYPVRLAICRGYYVSSDPRSCMPTNDPRALTAELAIMRFTPGVGREERSRIVALVESRGLNFGDSVLPLPKWLVLEMKWRGKW